MDNCIEDILDKAMSFNDIKRELADIKSFMADMEKRLEESSKRRLEESDERFNRKMRSLFGGVEQKVAVLPAVENVSFEQRVLAVVENAVENVSSEQRVLAVVYQVRRV